ncbi:hypothetical protein, partial [Ralstonia sp. SET104]|uniref:hypothetical protein n=1 Tax=Ralstonia sp. SET104 TaxID=2448774 RepID=UPI001C892A9C
FGKPTTPSKIRVAKTEGTIDFSGDHSGNFLSHRRDGAGDTLTFLFCRAYLKMVARPSHGDTYTPTFHWIATRHDKLARWFSAFISIAAAFIW